MTGRAALELDTLTIRIPMRLQHRGGRKLIMTPEGVAAPARKPSRDETLVKALVRAHRWRRKIESGQSKSIARTGEGTIPGVCAGVNCWLHGSHRTAAPLTPWCPSTAAFAGAASLGDSAASIRQASSTGASAVNVAAVPGAATAAGRRREVSGGLPSRMAAVVAANIGAILPAWPRPWHSIRARKIQRRSRPQSHRDRPGDHPECLAATRHASWAGEHAFGAGMPPDTSRDS
jgi:hypothetical protein